MGVMRKQKREENRLDAVDITGEAERTGIRTDNDAPCYPAHLD